jgi:hypothetical protein
VGWQGRAPQDRLYLNDGRGRFTDATAGRLPAETETTLDAKFADLDRDGDLDLVQLHGDRIAALLNDGRGRFTDATDRVLPAQVPAFYVGLELSDLNGDGWPDIYATMLSRAPNAGDIAHDRLLLHRGAVTR